MEKDFKIAELVEKLRNGEHIICLNCNKGEYKCANPQYIKKADFFRCDNCGDFIHVLSSDVIVE